MDNVIIAVRWISTFCCLLLSIMILVAFFSPMKAYFKKSIKIIAVKSISTKIYFMLCALLFIAVAVFNFILGDLYIIMGIAFILCAIILILRALLPNGVYQNGIISDFKHYKWDNIIELGWDENKLSFRDKKKSQEVLVFDLEKKEEITSLIQNQKPGLLPPADEADETSDDSGAIEMTDDSDDTTDNN